jgi:hypothetical protein
VFKGRQSGMQSTLIFAHLQCLMLLQSNTPIPGCVAVNTGVVVHVKQALAGMYRQRYAAWSTGRSRWPGCMQSIDIGRRANCICTKQHATRCCGSHPWGRVPCHSLLQQGVVLLHPHLLPLLRPLQSQLLGGQL